MGDRDELEALLRRIDGRPYPAWRDLAGSWRLAADLMLRVDRIQGDPFAAPSRVRIRVDGALPAELAGPEQRLAAEDWLLRRFGAGLHSTRRGSGRSGVLEVLRPGPEVVERSAVRVWPDGTVEVRFQVGLPARGRRVLGREGRDLLLGDVPDAARRLRVGGDEDAQELGAHIHSVRRQRALRAQLRPRGLVAFVEDGSVLPRATGVHQEPLQGAVPFLSPPSLAVVLDSPEGEVRGMGLPIGVSVIVGGGFHGKSTVLAALAHGHLDHIPGDGREGVVTDSDAVKIRAEDGRPVAGVDISAFLHDLPGGIETRPFHTEDASGSTSQAAAIVEAVESGARVLIFDEDTSATNLMVRDERMRALIPAHREPITPLVERVGAMGRDWGVSCILAVGGVGDWLGVADTVLAMDSWRATDATERARALGIRVATRDEPLSPPLERVPLPGGLRHDRVRARDQRGVRLGDEDIDLVAVEQVLDAPSAWTLGQALRFLGEELVDGRRTVRQVLDALDAILLDEGVEVLSPHGTPDGGLVRPRRHEVAAALNRLRSLRVHHPAGLSRS